MSGAIGNREMTWPELRAVVLDRAAHRCAMCGGRAVEVDHIFPRSLGGTHDLRNLQAACVNCNRRKGERGLTEAPEFFGHLTAGQLEAYIEAVAQWDEAAQAELRQANAEYARLLPHLTAGKTVAEAAAAIKAEATT